MGTKSKLWGGAFSESPNDLAWRFGQSIQDDRVLWKEEIEVCIAHAEMLMRTSIIPSEDAAKILEALAQLIADDRWLDKHEEAEDIHAALDAELSERIGESAKFLTTARSRNDQIATVSRLWLANRIREIVGHIEAFQRVALDLGEAHGEDPLLGTTHMQGAQPITLGYHLMAYFWMLQRDKERFETAASGAMNDCPLGSCALAGTSLPIDRDFIAKKLGFVQPSTSAIDSVSDRDFIGDGLHACSQAMVHLSRLCQELALWATPQFGYVRIADTYSTGSSLMPQKRNPDIAELIRGRASQAAGEYMAFMSMMRAQPLAYNRDMQDDKPGLYRVMALTSDSLVLSAAMLKTAQFDTGRMEADAGRAGATATDLVEQLVREGMSFREAHEHVGRRLKDMAPSDVGASIRARGSMGSPAPAAFAEQLASAKAALTAFA